MGQHGDVEKARLAWWPEVRDRSSDREPLTREQIVAAAIRIIDLEGLDALSMRRLGQELGAGATSLYWHVKNKDQLLDLVVDHLIGEVPLDDDPGQPWRDRVAHLSRSLRETLSSHGQIAVLLGSRVSIGPNALRGVDHLIGILRSAGFEGLRLGLAYQSLLNYATGYAVMESRPITGPGTEGKSPEELQAMVGEMLASLPADDYPNLTALPPNTAEFTADAQFEYGLQRMLDGMEAEVARDSERGRGPSAAAPAAG